jgi:hypothetical protein
VGVITMQIRVSRMQLLADHNRFIDQLEEAQDTPCVSLVLTTITMKAAKCKDANTTNNPPRSSVLGGSCHGNVVHSPVRASSVPIWLSRTHYTLGGWGGSPVG